LANSGQRSASLPETMIYPFRFERVVTPQPGSCGIHILHANSSFADPLGTMVASLVLHYTDGAEARLQIREGVHCLDWWAWPKGRSKVSDPNTLVAWTGRNPAATHQGAKLRLFKTAFVNPQPDKEIQSVDYVSGMAVSAPFMIAMTLEK